MSTLKELRRQATELNIPGRSKMGRQELEDAITDATINPASVDKSNETKGEMDMTENEDNGTVSIHEIIAQVSADFVNEQNRDGSVSVTDTDDAVTVDNSSETEAETFVPDYPRYDSIGEALKDQARHVLRLRRAIARGVGDWAEILFNSHRETFRELLSMRREDMLKAARKANA